jgi:hypothetical protein
MYRDLKSQTPATYRYNLALTPSDFFLFGDIKGKQSDYNCESREDLINTITEILTGIDQEVCQVSSNPR